MPRTVNVSEINDFLDCRARWYIKWVLNRVPKFVDKPLKFGTIFHRAMDKHITEGTPLVDGIRAEIEALKTDETVLPAVREEITAEYHDLEEILPLWEDKYPVEKTLEVETPFELPFLDGITVRGRPDRVAIIFGKVWHIQNRALASGKNIGLYTELAKRNLHELVYAWALKQKYPDYEYGGTLFNLVRKLKYRGKPTKKDPKGKVLHTPAEIMVQAPTPILEHLIEDAMRDVHKCGLEMMHEIDLTSRYKELPASNRRLDGGFYGSKRDPYFPVFTGEITLDNEEFFTDRADTYDDRKTDE